MEDYGEHVNYSQLYQVLSANEIPWDWEEKVIIRK